MFRKDKKGLHVGFGETQEPAITNRKDYIDDGDFYPGRGKRPAPVATHEESNTEEQTPSPKPSR